ncbi:MAG: hypothetical protein JXA94_06875 [Parachlamydiales bacterium]|nr:hypothetical protein [Parachlamydiales bacterium]
MKMFKYFLNLIILAFFFTISIKAWHKINAGFRVDKITNIESFFEKSQTVDIDDNILNILDQEFSFFNKGRQSFVFESNDGKYVIKLFRYHKYEKPFWHDAFLKKLSFLDNFIEKLQKEKTISYQQTMDSYNLAYEKLKNETGLIYLHIDQNKKFNKIIKIKDRFKRSYFVDLDQTGFVIQRKTNLLIPTLYYMKNDLMAVKNVLNAFFDNINSVYEKNVYNDDRHVLKNLGIISGTVLELDIGRLKYKNDLLEFNNYKNEITYYTQYLRKWLSKNIPEALPYFEIKLNDYINSKA